MVLTKEISDSIIKEMNNIKSACEKNRNGIDATWVCLRVPMGSWKQAKALGLEKDSHWGYMVWKGSVNSNGTTLQIEANRIAAEYGLSVGCVDL
jgi:hypothetical protein